MLGAWGRYRAAAVHLSADPATAQAIANLEPAVFVDLSTHVQPTSQPGTHVYDHVHWATHVHPPSPTFTHVHPRQHINSFLLQATRPFPHPICLSFPFFAVFPFPSDASFSAKQLVLVFRLPQPPLPCLGPLGILWLACSPSTNTASVIV